MKDNKRKTTIQLPETSIMPPNHVYANLHRVALNAKKGINEAVRFVTSRDGSQFSVFGGQEGCKVGPNRSRVIRGPFVITAFDDEYQKFVERGYRLTFDAPPTLGEIRHEGSYAPMPDPDTDRLIKSLVEVSRQCFEEFFTLSTERVTEIPKKNIDEARQVIAAMAATGEEPDVKEFNDALMALYEILPRRTDNLWDFVARSKDDYKAILKRESETIDLLVQQIQMAEAGAVVTDSKPNYAQAHGFDIRPVNAAEKEEIMDKLHGTDSGDSFDRRTSYRAAWRIYQHERRKEYDAYATSHGIGIDGYEHGQSELWHGTGTENLISIINNGLLLNPDADICGKALGNGIYHAPSAEKSAGYVSGSSRWRAADGSKASFMLLCDVLTGSTYDIDGYGGHPNNAAELERLQPGADSLWYHGGCGGFAHDEVVVYRECQTAVKYLIELTY